MKKTLSINIGGFVFIIDEDAYQILLEYVEKLNLRYKSTEAGKEIISDIESRIAELLQIKLVGRQVVSIEDVNEIIAQLGTPEDFEDDEEIEKDNIFESQKTEKIIFRDPNNRVIGGVCGGLSNYFGVNANIIRIIFLIAFLVYGSGSLIYIILWIVMPEAKTTTQKLVMKGEKITIQSIENSIKHEFKSVKTNFLKWKNTPANQNVNNSVAKFMDFVFSVFNLLAKFIIVFIGLNFILTGLFVILVIVVGPFLSNIFIVPNNLKLEGVNLLDLGTIFTSHTNLILAYIGVVLTGVIPMLAMIYMGVKIVLRINHRNKIMNITMLGLWFVGIIISVFSIVKVVNDYKSEETYEQSNIIEMQSDTIYIQSNTVENQFEKYKDYDKIDIDKVIIFAKQNEREIYIRPKLNIKKSKSDKIELVYNYKSRGNTRKDALDYCKSIKYTFNKIDSLLVFDSFYTYSENSKWHGEMLDITLYVPENKFVYMEKSSRNIIYDIENVVNMWEEEMVEKMWKMTNNGLNLADSVLVQESIKIERDSVVIEK